MVLQPVPPLGNDGHRAMTDEPLPQAIVWILNRALNPVEAAHLLRIYREYGVDDAVRKGLWLNKSRSKVGREHWREYNRRRTIARRNNNFWRAEA